MSIPRNLLFICTENLQRSPTAAALVRDRAGDSYDVRSAGTSPFAETQVTQAHVDWADEIFVMETRHRAWLKDHCDLHDTPVHVLDIPDHYIRNDPELVQLLEEKLASLIDLYAA